MPRVPADTRRRTALIWCGRAAAMLALCAAIVVPVFVDTVVLFRGGMQWTVVAAVFWLMLICSTIAFIVVFIRKRRLYQAERAYDLAQREEFQSHIAHLSQFELRLIPKMDAALTKVRRGRPKHRATGYDDAEVKLKVQKARALQRKGYTQETIARLLNTSPKTLRRWMTEWYPGTDRET